MQSARIVLTICVVISAAVNVSCSSAKLRRDGVLNLYPFPRVGRSHHTWQVPINGPNEHMDNEMVSKRQLYAFPRVGRNSFGYPDQYQPNLNRLNVRLEDILGQPRSHEYVKRENEEIENGMWFGPRVGRSYNYGDMDSWSYASDRSDPEVTENESIQRNKRQAKHF